jgi:hypothetical protein
MLLSRPCHGRCHSAVTWASPPIKTAACRTRAETALLTSTRFSAGMRAALRTPFAPAPCSVEPKAITEGHACGDRSQRHPVGGLCRGRRCAGGSRTLGPTGLRELPQMGQGGSRPHTPRMMSASPEWQRPWAESRPVPICSATSPMWASKAPAARRCVARALVEVGVRDARGRPSRPAPHGKDESQRASWSSARRKTGTPGPLRRSSRPPCRPEWACPSQVGRSARKPSTCGSACRQDPPGEATVRPPDSRVRGAAALRRSAGAVAALTHVCVRWTLTG